LWKYSKKTKRVSIYVRASVGGEKSYKETMHRKQKVRQVGTSADPLVHPSGPRHQKILNPSLRH